MSSIPITDIQSGDLLLWSSSETGFFSNALVKLVKFLTRSKFGHVGIAWRCHDGMDDELLVIEATIPKIHISRVTDERKFFCIPMNSGWNTRNKAFLIECLGLPYSVRDAVYAYLGFTPSADDRWQCAELAHEFYKKSGIDLPDGFTPGKLAEHASAYSGYNAMRVLKCFTPQL